MMNRIRTNEKIFGIWAAIASVVTIISMFCIFYLRRNNPAKQNIKTFGFATIVAFGCVIAIKRAIRVQSVVEGNSKKYVTQGDLKGRHAILIDLLGVSMFVQILAIWWSKATVFYLVVPGYIIYFFSKKLVQWLHYS